MKLRELILHESARHRASGRRAALLGGVVGLASVLLLGLSGWFLTAAALAGAAGSAVALGFNYMLPSAAIRLLAIARTGARYGEAVFSHDAGLRIGARLRPALFAATAAAPVRQALAVARGSMLRVVMDDVARIETALVRRSAQWNAAGAAVSGLAMVALAGVPAAAVLVALLAATILANEALARRTRRSEARRDEALAELRLAADELLAAAPELRCYRHADAGQFLERPGRALALAGREAARARALAVMIQAGCMTLAAIAVLALSGGGPAPTAALATLAAAMATDGLAPLLRQIAERFSTRDSANRLDQLLAHEQQDMLPVVIGRPTLDLLGVHLKPGDRLQLEGQSGVGKTTLIEHLIGLRCPVAGRAKVAGVDVVFLRSEQLRSTFAWQPQDAAALSGTVRDNLLIARAGACDRALWQALHDAALDELVRALPHGLDSWIGEDGARLSGGERRRLAVARALVADAPWLLLDEPIEGLDPATAQLLLERLERRLCRTGQGLVVVSHRPLSCITRCRSVVVPQRCAAIEITHQPQPAACSLQPK